MSSSIWICISALLREDVNEFNWFAPRGWEWSKWTQLVCSKAATWWNASRWARWPWDVIHASQRPVWTGMVNGHLPMYCRSNNSPHKVHVSSCTKRLKVFVNFRISYLAALETAAELCSVDTLGRNVKLAKGGQSWRTLGGWEGREGDKKGTWDMPCHQKHPTFFQPVSC